MRKSVYVIFILIVAGIVFTCARKSHVTRTDVLTEAIERDFMDSYTDSLWGYTITYPSFFERVPDSMMKDTAAVCFRYWNEELIELSAFVLPNRQGYSLAQGMDSIAALSHATRKRLGNDSFTISGPVYVDGGEMAGYVYYAKYVRHRKLWFVQRLVYPEEYERVVRRLIARVNQWKVWEDGGADIAY